MQEFLLCNLGFELAGMDPESMTESCMTGGHSRLTVGSSRAWWGNDLIALKLTSDALRANREICHQVANNDGTPSSHSATICTRCAWPSSYAVQSVYHTLRLDALQVSSVVSPQGTLQWGMKTCTHVSREPRSTL
mmetsp:Transcript_4711/g.13734  ORF Transcript_4711/g.13734 Transcript_4711/m.13734 type:complete len:135 (-) Transcript_4711:70-474(-)